MFWRQPVRQPQSQRLSSSLVTQNVTLFFVVVVCWPMDLFLAEWNMVGVSAVFPCVPSGRASYVSPFVACTYILS